MMRMPLALATALLAGSASAQSISPTMSDDLRIIQKQVIDQERSGSNAMLVVQDGDVVHKHVENSVRRGDRDIEPNTLFPIWSMSKPITIVAVMTLHEQGLFEWDDPVSKYLPCFERLVVEDGEGVRPARTPLRIVDLMTHRSGWGYPRMGGGPPTRHDEPVPSQSKYADLQEFCEAVAAHPLQFDPGTAYLYGVNQAILGRFVEVLSGRPFATYLEETIFEPLGMTETSFVLDDERRTRFQPLYINRGDLQGYTDLLDELNYHPESRTHFGGEGLVSTLDDYARFCEMLLGRGEFRGRRILSEDSIDTILEVHTPDFAPGLDMGFSVYIVPRDDADGQGTPAGVFGWGGYHNTHFWVDPANDLFVVYMSRTRDFDAALALQLKNAIYERPEDRPESPRP